MPNLKLIVSIINYLKDEAKKESMNADTQESLEVAVQCLQTAYDLEPKDARLVENALPMSLEDIFVSALPPEEEEVDDVQGAAAREPMNKAEIMKNLGNNLMRSNNFSEAIRYYTAAIEIDGTNAVYYCNRAAAYSKLDDFQSAIKDCEKAVELDPQYAKAYSRMGLAYTSLEQNDLALKAFRKALEAEPCNESYQNNLKIALQKKEMQNQSPLGSGLAGLNNVDWQALFVNPAFRNMASTIMNDPSIINALSAGIASPQNNPPPPSNLGNSGNVGSDDSSAGIPGASGNRSLDMLLEAGQYLAAQMQAANPDLVQQFRNSSSRNPPNQDNKDSSAK